MSRWLITGAAGMLGRELTDALLRQGEIVTGMSRADLDVTDEAAVSAAVTRSHPDVVVNCAGWTAVDAAETSEDAALAVNGRGPAHLAVACAATGARLVQLSASPTPGWPARVVSRTASRTRRRRAPPTAGPSWPASGPR
jgi:dTDP-4-dehydrorhamnose reductase